MLTPHQATKGRCMVSCFIGLAIHGTVEEFLIFHDDGQFAVVYAKLRLQYSAEAIFRNTRGNLLYH